MGIEGTIVRRLRDPRCRYTARAMVTVQLKSAGVSMHFRPHRHSRPVRGSLNESTKREGMGFDSLEATPFLLSSRFFSSSTIHRETSTTRFPEISINVSIERSSR